MKKPILQYDSRGESGNIYWLLANVRRLLQRERRSAEYSKLQDRVFGSHSYEEALAEIPLFYGRGSFDMEAMSFTDRTLCGMLRKAVAKKAPEDLEVWEKALMEAGGSKCDWTDRKYIEPVIGYIKTH